MANQDNARSPGTVPRFYVWGREILYLGTEASQPAPHRVAHDKLMVSLDGDFWINTGEGFVRSRSCLMTTGQWHDRKTVDTSGAVTATWLLPSFSQDVPSLTRIMDRAGPDLYYDHPQENQLIGALMVAGSTVGIVGDVDVDRTRQHLRQWLLPSEFEARVFRVFDPRVLEVVRRVRQTANLNLPIGHYASEVGLSSSYLEKLFKAQTGLPITQFRLRYRTYVSAILLGMGYSITEAALKAGFSSSSHFSRTHRALTGETASSLFIRSGAQSIIDRRVLKSVLQLVRGSTARGSRGSQVDTSE